jgi:hypothetical protein
VVPFDTHVNASALSRELLDRPIIRAGVANNSRVRSCEQRVGVDSHRRSIQSIRLPIVPMLERFPYETPVIPLYNTLVLITNRNLGTGVAHYPRLTANLKGDEGVFGGSQG